MVEERIKIICFHCGDDCKSDDLQVGDKHFCCNGCLNVYSLLNNSGLDDYYCLNENPGQKVESTSKEKFAFLDEDSVVEKLLSFRNNEQARVSLHLPQMHCSSCLWLLENLSELNENIIHSQVNFQDKNITITYDVQKITLREVAELLTHIGYEPLIDLYDHDKKAKDPYNSKKAYLKLGITGFAFSNIMMIAFPDYLGLDPTSNPFLDAFFNYANLILALPVVFYGAQEFFVKAWLSIRQRYLNIDAPIALAVAVTFLRSVYEVISGTGAGYFDSMAGIVFFMLLGRTLQNRSYSTLKFNRDYKSYFPIAVTRIKDGERKMVKLQNIDENDVLLIHHLEVIPTDCLLSKGKAVVDYSFITGEEKHEEVEKGGLIYAGGKNMGESIEVLTVKSFNQNSFTQLWNNSSFDEKDVEKESTVTLISRYFSYIVFTIATLSFIIWQFIEPEIGWKAATAVLIIACPCALLLTASFTNGYLMERFANFGFFLKNATVIESLTKINHVAFDKTGTLTEPDVSSIEVLEDTLSDEEREIVLYAAAQSFHPLSRALVAYYAYEQEAGSKEIIVKEVMGNGVEAWYDDRHFKLGSYRFIMQQTKEEEATRVYVGIDGEVKAIYEFSPKFRENTVRMIERLKEGNELSMISGDNSKTSKAFLKQYFTDSESLNYEMSPQDKLDYVERLQSQGKKVMMVGDGLNDAGALQQSEVGIAVVKNSFSFSPASDVIVEAQKLHRLPDFMGWAVGGQRLIRFGFIYSVVFNLIGLGFAITGNLSPLVAAIIMPMSSFGIILIAYLGVRKMTAEAKKWI